MHGCYNPTDRKLFFQGKKEKLHRPEDLYQNVNLGIEKSGEILLFTSIKYPPSWLNMSQIHNKTP